MSGGGDDVLARRKPLCDRRKIRPGPEMDQFIEDVKRLPVVHWDVEVATHYAQHVSDIQELLELHFPFEQMNPKSKWIENKSISGGSEILCSCYLLPICTSVACTNCVFKTRSNSQTQWKSMNKQFKSNENQ